jgi:Flp pilus assembly protein TadD
MNQGQATVAIEQELQQADAYLATGLTFEAAEIFARHRDSTHSREAHMGLATCAFLRRDLHEALGHLQIVAREDPEHPGLANSFGAVYFGLGLMDQALEQFSRAVALEPEDDAAWRNLAHLQHRTDDLEGCAASCRRLLELAPDDAQALELLEAVNQMQSAPAASAG